MVVAPMLEASVATVMASMQAAAAVKVAAAVVPMLVAAAAAAGDRDSGGGADAGKNVSAKTSSLRGSNLRPSHSKQNIHNNDKQDSWV